MHSNVRRIFTLLTCCGGLLAASSTIAAAQMPDDMPPPQPSGDPEAAGGKLEADTEMWEFGKVWFGEKLTRDVKITNVSDKPVKILNVRTPCSCTTATLAKKEFAPGESDTLKIGFDSTKSSRVARKWVNIETNIPERKYLRVMLSGEVLPIVEVEPRDGGRIGRILRHDPFERNFKLTCAYDKPMDLQMRDVESEFFDFKFYEEEPGKVYRLDVKSKPNMPEGAILFNIEFDTGVEICPVWKMKLEGYSLNRVNAFPQEVYVPRTRKNKSEQFIYVVNERAKPLRIKSVKANFKGIEMGDFDEPQPLQDNPQFEHRKMKVTIPRGQLIPLDGSGRIFLETDSAETPTLEVIVTNKMPEYLRQLRENAARGTN